MARPQSQGRILLHQRRWAGRAQADPDETERWLRQWVTLTKPAIELIAMEIDSAVDEVLSHLRDCLQYAEQTGKRHDDENRLTCLFGTLVAPRDEFLHPERAERRLSAAYERWERG